MTQSDPPRPGSDDPFRREPEQAPPSEWPPPPPAYPPAPPPQQQPGYPPQYQQQQYGAQYGGQYAPPGSGTTNGFAIASLVLGILWISWIGSILALVFGYIGKNQIDRGGRVQGGRGLAVAGIVLGWIGVAFLALFIVFAIIGASTTPSDDF